MKPVERWKSFQEGSVADRIPCYPFIDTHAAVLAGRSIRDYSLNPEVLAECQLKAYRRYRHDCLSTFTDGYLIAEALGARLTFTGSSPAYLDGPAGITNVDRIPELTLESGRIPVVLAAARLLIDEVGDEVPVGCALQGPVTTAAGLVGLERLLGAMLREPAFVEDLIGVAVERLMVPAAAYADIGAAVGITDPVCSSNLISPAAYRRFGLPAHRRLIGFLRERGLNPGLHICGRADDIVADMLDTEAGTLSLDRIDFGMAKTVVGDRAALQTGVRTETTLLLGRPEDVRAEATRVLQVLGDHRGGFVLGTTCEVPPRTPPENIDAILEAARMAGPYRRPFLRERLETGQSAW